MKGTRVIRCVVEIVTSGGDYSVPVAVDALENTLRDWPVQEKESGIYYGGIIEYTVSMK